MHILTATPTCSSHSSIALYETMEPVREIWMCIEMPQGIWAFFLDVHQFGLMPSHDGSSRWIEQVKGGLHVTFGHFYFVT